MKIYIRINVTMDKFNQIIEELFTLYSKGEVTKKQLKRVSSDINQFIGEEKVKDKNEFF
jgi:hypothetical protein